MTTKRIATAIIAGALLFGTVGCGAAAEKVSEKATEKAIEKAAGGDVDIDTKGDGKVTYKDKDGNAITYGNSELPEGWSKDLTIPKGFKLLSSSSLKSDGGTIKSITAQGKGDAKKVYNGLKSMVADNGYEISQDSVLDMSSNGGSGITASLTATKADRAVTIAVYSGDDGEVTLSINDHPGDTP